MDSSDVIRGVEDWLFLWRGSNDVGRQYDRSGVVSDASIQSWADLIATRAKRFAALGIPYVHLAIPEKITIYDSKLTPPPVDWSLSPAVRLREALKGRAHSDVLLDLVEPFRSERDAQQLFFKTDTHWSAEGCYLAYALLCARIGIEPDQGLLSKSYQELRGQLDLGAKLDPVVFEDVRFYAHAKHARRVYANPVVKFLETPSLAPRVHVGSHVRWRNEKPGIASKRLLIFGDSYSSQRDDALTGMLAETVTEVEFIWSSSLDWHYIEKSKPDVVIYELAERFMTLLPKDTLDMRWMTPRQMAKAAWIQWRARYLG